MQFDQKWLETPGFDWRKVYALAAASKLSYSGSKEVQRVLRDRWKMGGAIFSKGQTQGFVAVGPKVAIVAMRGTQGLGDWLRNADLAPTGFPPAGGKVHQGFLKAWLDVADIVNTTLDGAPGRRIWLTGHSLGGAIAVLATAAGLGRNPAGLVTFGQPLLLNDAAAAFMAGRLGARYTRIVNADDIVARVPPGYRHTGRLFHFGLGGGLEGLPGLAEGLGIEADPSEPMSEPEFRALQQQIDALDTPALSGSRAGSAIEFGMETPFVADERDVDTLMEGVIPGIADHRMDVYLNLMRRQAFPGGGAEIAEAMASLTVRGLRRDIDPVFEAALPTRHVDSPVDTPAGPDRTRSGAAPLAGPVRQPVLVRLHGNPDWTGPADMPIGSRIANILTAYASRDDMLALQGDPQVAIVEVSREAGMAELTDAVPFVKADVVQRPPIGERGDGCLVGIVDTGVDILHRAFRDSDGKTRIQAIWDQTAARGPTPKDVDAAFTQDYGRLYLKDDIDRFIADFEAGAPSHPPALRDPGAPSVVRAGHGTHVAGIAAGRATANQPDGIAPDAGLIVVMSSIQPTAGNPFSIGYSSSHVDGLSFLQRAAMGGTPVLGDAMPIAINVSQGMNAGAHDGTTTLEAAFDAITGIGRTPGIVIVKSAGNEREQAGHAMKRAFTNGIEEIRWTSSTDVRNSDYFEAWFDGLDDVAFTLIDPQGNRSAEVSFDNPSVNALLGNNICQLRLTNTHPDNGHNRLTLTIQSAPNLIQSGTWVLELNGRSVLSEKGEVHIWVERTGGRDVRFKVEDEEMTLSIPGTAQTVICVAACNSSVPLRMLPASSQGLTRDGRPKPELSAPGIDIASAWSGQADLEASIAMSGTSMAAPQVTGALALVMSHRRKTGQAQLNAVQLKSGLIQTVQALPVHHHIGAGYGVLDVRKLFDRFR
ncbi:MAG: hypothetical protein CML66_10900 [Rhodobacteraceae bacterium]|nr:hypothetical protein [Paracoccaceae bacterium]MAY46656.1 hypothetical protein [Paracoccaceae bacterium]